MNASLPPHQQRQVVAAPAGHGVAAVAAVERERDGVGGKPRGIDRIVTRTAVDNQLIVRFRLEIFTGAGAQAI